MVLIKLAVRQILTYTVIMQTNPEVAIEISLRPQDVYHPLLFSRRNLARWVLFLFAAYLTFDTRSIWLSALEDPDRSAGVLVLLLAGTALFIGWLVYPYFRVWSMFRKSPRLRMPRRIRFSDEGIRIESEHGQGEYKWSIFQKVVESRRTFFFMRTSAAFRNRRQMICAS
jgi:YcxB-like protein